MSKIKMKKSDWYPIYPVDFIDIKKRELFFHDITDVITPEKEVEIDKEFFKEAKIIFKKFLKLQMKLKELYE